MRTQIDLLKKYRLRIVGTLGQNFLIDPNLQRKMVAEAELKASENVLEIGPGLGGLTAVILEYHVNVLAVERDQRFIPILEAEIGSRYPEKLKILHGDILKFDIGRYYPASARKKKIKVIGNLPYYLSSPVLFYLIDNRKWISRAVITVQKEMGERILASPGTKSYGRLTLGIRLFADVRHVFNISASCFTPKPDVDSMTLVLTFHADKQLPPKALRDRTLHLIATAFSHRRKTLINLLSHDPVLGEKRERLLSMMKSLGLSETVRGEEMLLKDYLALAGLLPENPRSRGKKK